VAAGCIIAVFEPQEPPVHPTPENVIQGSRQAKIDIILTPPSNIVEWSKNSETVAYLATLEFVRSTSGPTPTPVGDFLVSQGVPLLNGWGATELGNMSITYPDKAYGVDWEWIAPMSNTKPIFEPHGEGVYEICFGCTETRTPSVFNDAENHIYRTNDLVILHPTRKDWFKVVGRADDQLMLSTGEKTNPGPLESIIRGCPLVRAALYFGRGRSQNGVLIEPSPGHDIDPTDPVAVSEFRNAIWRFVEDANRIAPTHSRIFKETILIASSQKPFHYTPKGSVSRERTLAIYDREIEELYAVLEDVSTSNVKTPVSWTEQNASSYVKAVVAEVMGLDRPDGPDDSEDLFIQGCDSLQATVIRNRLHSALRETIKSPPALPPDWVYANSTIPRLSAAFYQAATMDSLTSGPASTMSSVDMLEATIQKYTSNFPQHIGTRALPKHHTILLSGATGTLGCYLLSAFAKDPKVSRVYAINRPSSRKSGYQRQIEALRNRGLDTSILHDGSVVLIDADLSKTHFAISDRALLDQMQASVTCIVHNAWRLDFNLGITSFVPNIESTRNLVDFALRSPYKEPPCIFFTSSISTIGAHTADRVPEESGDPRWVNPIGYAQSKFTAERILEAAPLKSCSIRVGQLSGSRVNGAWNVSDWFPMIVKSGEATGCLPMRNDEVSWLPTDAAAQVIFELVSAEPTPSFAHIVHPQPVEWSRVINPIAESIGAQVIAYDEWIARIEKQTDFTENPAFKLLSYYKSKAPTKEAAKRTIETEKTASLSHTLATLPQLALEDFDKWIAYWRQQGFLKGGLGSRDLSNGNLSNGNLSNGNLSNGNLSNGNLSNGNLSNGDLSHGGLSNGDRSHGGLSNGGLSNHKDGIGKESADNEGSGNISMQALQD
jgi:thioester reductase-like protein